VGNEKIWIAESTLRESAGTVLKREGFIDKEIESTLSSWLYAEYSGKASHGFERLPWLLEMVRSGKIIPGRDTAITKNGFHIHINGDCALGYSAADLAVSESIRTAAASGVSIVTVSGCYPTGCMGQYTEAIAESGLIGIAISHSPSRVAPYGATSAVFGTTGHSFGFPSAGEMPYVYDSSVGAVTNGDIMKAFRDGAPVPARLFNRADGAEAGSFEEIIATNGMVNGVIGVAGERHAHRFSGLAGSFELLLRLALLPVGSGNRADNYSIFIAIDPGWFGDASAYRDLVHSLQEAVRDARPEHDGERVRFAGEQSWQRRSHNRSAGGIQIEASLHSQLLQERQDEMEI